MTSINKFALGSQRMARLLTPCLVVLALLPGAGASAETVIIVNPGNKAPIDQDLIGRIFLGQVKTFPGGAEAVPVDLKGGPTRDEFNDKILKKTAPQIKAHWSRLVFSGGGRPPQMLEDDDAVVKFVTLTPNGIGYVDSARAGGGVKVVK